MTDIRREHARTIWEAGVAAVRPEHCLPQAMHQVERLAREWFEPGARDRILVLGGGKAGAAMSGALLRELTQRGVGPTRILGLVNVPRETAGPCGPIQLWPARPAGTNQPTAEGAEGARRILDLAAKAEPSDLLICLISGGGSALLPAPASAISLQDKQEVTALLHRCGATIQEMNAVRKHLSLIKGGGLVRHFRGKLCISLIISDVLGDPLDVIASGPTAVDPTTFADALGVLEKFGLREQVPAGVLAHLRRGAAGAEPETLKTIPVDAEGRPLVHNLIIANNAMALAAAERKAEALGYRVRNLGPHDAGDTQALAERMALELVDQPHGLCILSGGETTVTLPSQHGLGGRNQEFVLAALCRLGQERLDDLVLLSGGTDGEDGPTDAAGAIGDAGTLAHARALGLDPADYLARHDAYRFFERVGGLLKTGLTQTNVMDLRVVLT